VATGRASHDVAADLKDALAPVASRNFASVTDPVKVGELLRAIDGYSGQPITALALKLAPLVFVCPGELRGAEWSEFDLDNSQWRIPGPRMKMGDPHIVPLSSQAVEILKELERFTGTGKFVFPSLLSRDRPMSENTINAALRRMGYSGDDQTGHRFRSMASTLLNEQGFPPDVIELQLAHAERNKVRAAYNKAQRLAERRTMMQAWADYWISFGKADSGDIGVDTNLTKIPDPGRDTGRGRPNGSILSTVDTVQDMTMDAKLKDLPLDERIKLVEDLWDSIAADQNALPLTAEQKAELDRRLEAYEIDKNPGRLASEAIADIRRRL
jgi:putative addiction module component (TIGR02574 family)